MIDYWVSVERVYKVTSDSPLTKEQIQTLIENGQGSLKEVNWGFDEGLEGDN
jgi:hypothetical protein